MLTPDNRARRRRGKIVALALSLLTLALARPLGAQAPAGPAAPAASAAELEARALVVEGNRLYQAGRFEDAVDRYHRAYARNPRPRTLFNLAQAYRQLKNVDRALEHYRAYLKAVPGSANRAQVQDIVAELEAERQKLRPRSPPPAPVAVNVAPAEPAAPPPAAWYRRWYVWTIVGAVVVGGAVAGAVAATRPAGTNVPATDLGNRVLFAP